MPATQAKKKLVRTTVPVLSVEHPSRSLTLVRLGRPTGFEFAAGQWTYVWLPGDEDEYKRPYSIASPPHDREGLDFCIKRVAGGPLSTHLYDCHPGSTVEVSRALGSFQFKSPDAIPIVFLGTGTGVAPLRSMILDRFQKEDARPMWLFLGSGEEGNLPYHHEFQRLAAQHKNFQYVPVLSRGPLDWPGDRGWIQEALEHRLHGHREYHAYLCGLKRMVDDVANFLSRQGLPPQAIHFERYD